MPAPRCLSQVLLFLTLCCCLLLSNSQESVRCHREVHGGETYSEWASCTVVEGKASAALGRALMGTLLLGALKGDAETVQVLYTYSLLSSLDISAYVWQDLHMTVPNFQRSRHCKNAMC